jgi:hypothetical protein
MLYALCITIIGEAFGETLKNTGALFNLPKQQAPAVGSNGSATEISDYFSFPQDLK